ncbi:UBC-like protein [Wallemia mellicola CBS 633.66]|uniref:UBC-like protein n=1 Tax=Wallemia mellicola (strain ATCC MYA-4683 / CBS 633.66) TaxID=671144 RepID=I4Y540_WALMC|nr:UBC-like protein [Wallemia mellicola CBS 633.66]EIM19082.1 UBC-like protein [Wallemia mellicola CBS 633.66]|eukprot:XP_006960866.1 UBC-like protein [Wallemia mellicola CBS 633.66]
MSQLSTKRLTKELKDLKDKGCPAGITLLESDDLRKWTFELEAYDSIYQGEKFALMFRFSDQYPIDSPAVQFIVNNTKGYLSPVHPHIYSNGHICASILSDGWSPVLNVAAVCLTIQSMLTSCKSKERPPDNDGYVARAPENPKKTRWEFHDDSV